MPPATYSGLGSIQRRAGYSKIETGYQSKFKSPIADLPINTPFYVQYATACKYMASQMAYSQYTQQQLPSQEYCVKLILESMQDVSLCFLKSKL